MSEVDADVVQRYTALVMLIRQQLALQDSGCFADGVEPDRLTFTKTWVRAKIRHAVRDGVLVDDHQAREEADGARTPRPR